jgi:hypothetical protein
MGPILTLHDPGMAREFYANGFWRGDTLYSLACRQSPYNGVRLCRTDWTEQLGRAAMTT